jgi:chain length determinant protein (polysaccharide antigen chain regulator)
MAEKEIPMSSIPDQVQNLKYEPEDEINLLDLLVALVKKKVLIFSIASIFFVLSIFYAFSIKTTYRATISFKPTVKDLISIIPNTLYDVLPNTSRDKNGNLVIKNNYMFNEYIEGLRSYSNQEKVFIEGNFYKRFPVNNPKIEMKEIVREIYRSIHVSDGEGVSVKVASFEMKGVKSEVASDFLNALSDWTKNKVEFDIKESIQNEVKNQIASYSEKLNYELSLEKKVYEDKVRIFTHNLRIAKKLGILDNKFVNFKPSNPEWSLEPGLSKTHTIHLWPIWYLYGQRALEEELRVLRSQSNSIQHTKKYNIFNSQIVGLSKIALNPINLGPVIISQPSIPEVYPVNISKIQVIAIGIAFGLFIGIFIALLSCLITQLKKRSEIGSS